MEEGTALIGTNKRYTIVNDDETLTWLAVEHNLGYNEIVDANPGLDPWYPGRGREVLLPQSWILPDLQDPGSNTGQPYLVINLAELRLYHMMTTELGLRVITFPLGVGREGLDTPLGEERVTGKLKDPAWYVPASIREEDPTLPAIVPPGPLNPLGSYALRLSTPGYLIHGTNKPLGVGRRISHGCIRMYPEDIKNLYSITGRGSRVAIIYQPIKAGLFKDLPYIEVHRDYLNEEDQHKKAADLLRKKGLFQMVDTQLLEKAVREKTGVPVAIGLISSQQEQRNNK